MNHTEKKDELAELQARCGELEELARGMFKMIATSQELGAAIERDSPRAREFAGRLIDLGIKV